jgi:hypothetical protein
VSCHRRSGRREQPEGSTTWGRLAT